MSRPATRAGNEGKARKQFLTASEGPNHAVAALATRQLRYLMPEAVEDWTGDHWLIEAYRLKREGAVADAEEAFVSAVTHGADARLVALELAAVAENRGDLPGARKHYLVALQGKSADDYEVRARRGLATTAPAVREEWSGDHWVAEAHFLASLGDYTSAVKALDLGRGAPDANDAIIAEYRAALEDARKWTEFAREHLSEARAGRDRGVAEEAQKHLDGLPPAGRKAWTEAVWLQNARFLRSLGDLDGSVEAYGVAREMGADPQLVDLELAYLELSRQNIKLARRYFKAARKGEDDRYANQARAELKVMPRLFSADIYSEVFGYSRVAPRPLNNLIGFLRVRGFVRPLPLDLQPYIFLQISRDVGSVGVNQVLPQIVLNDNSLLLGGGLLFRFWEQKAGVYVQIAAAFKLIADGDAQRVDWDLRVGAYVGPSLPTCNPEPQHGGARMELLACAEFYGDVTYVSRFQHNDFFFARGRFGATWIVTGPVA